TVPWQEGSDSGGGVPGAGPGSQGPARTKSENRTLGSTGTSAEKNRSAAPEGAWSRPFYPVAPGCAQSSREASRTRRSEHQSPRGGRHQAAGGSPGPVPTAASAGSDGFVL